MPSSPRHSQDRRRHSRRSGRDGAGSGPGSRSGAKATAPADPALDPRKAELRDRLGEVSLVDSQRLGLRIGQSRNDAELDAAEEALAKAAAKLEKRRAGLPEPSYPEELPVSGRREDIAEAIAANQVVVIAGETGSGKTTQIPKICLDLGRGVRGAIAHTQPRRLAARTVAARIAAELDVELGAEVGYAVRFDDKTSDRTAIKLMTDGLLLNEIRRDRLLRAYDTIIIDEAHERSLNIDFLLGYLASILPKRPDLKVIITSATIEPERFAAHFASPGGEPAPIIEVSGRTYPVEVRYRPLVEEIDGRTVDRDPMDGLCDAVGELLGAGDGDILVFLSGEQEIRDAEEAIRGRKFRALDVFPLYSRLSTAEQNKAFRRHSRRRVVLATNIAETSVTVPGIHYVIDTGLARISRYSTRTKVQRLPIEEISQASANQRKGRSGRVAEGICVRLYSEEDFEARPEFTDPEILRTNLASVILQMADLGLGAIADFPFVDPPDSKSIRDGLALLDELGALAEAKSGEPRLTALGRDIAALPLDPRLARMLLAGRDHGALAETIVIVAALTVGDVRERPAEERDKATAAHSRFVDKTSDFLGYLNVWRYITEQRAELSGSAFRKMCKAEYLHWLRIREWQDLGNQLSSVCRERGWHPGSLTASDDDVHRSLLAGLLSSIGARKEETREFAGARGLTFHIHPSSALSKKPPRWVMAAELVETSRLFARDVARIDPAWVEPIAGHMVKRNYSEPHWSSKQGAAMAYEKVTLLGLPIVENRRILLSRVDAPLARELFVRHGIVEGGWSGRSPELTANRELVAEARELQTRSRRAGAVADDEQLVAWYLERIPESVVSGRHFDSWIAKAPEAEREHMRLTESDIRDEATGPSERDFPPAWKQGELTFELEYTHDPRSDADGVAVRIPLTQLAHVRSAGFEWLVPGLRTELYTELIRTLPKMFRRLASPAGSFADLVAADVEPRRRPLVSAVAESLSARIGSTIPASEFHPEQLPEHLRMTFVVIDSGGSVVDSGHSLPALQSKLADRARQTLLDSLANDADGPYRSWTPETIGDLADEVSAEIDGVDAIAYPAIEVRSDGIHRTVCTSRAQRSAAMTRACIALLRGLGLVSTGRLLKGRHTSERLALTQYPYGGIDALASDATVVAIGRTIGAAGGAPLTAAGYAELETHARRDVPGAVARLIATVLPALVQDLELRPELERMRPSEIVDELREELDFLIGRGFLARHSAAQLGQLERHLRSIGMRVRMAEENPRKYDALRARIADTEDAVAEARTALEAHKRNKQSREIAWLLAELRVSVYTQTLGTAGSVSEKKISQAIKAAFAQGARKQRARV
ncbi:ATP-dependent RNA helicase HrpA [Dietzia sp.]|uniref:ATP-dependent RNA helicase HrpA n=1 Tax=Dietzia sp. TaxID=1871616 RepID=UPI002FD92871